MKKFLLLTCLMVAFASAVSFGQIRTVTYYNNYAPEDAPRKLSWSVAPMSGKLLVTSSANLTGEPGEPAIDRTNVGIYVEYLDNTYYEEYNTSSSNSVDILWEGYSSPSAAGIKKISYVFEVLFVNADSEIYEVVDVY